MSCGGGEENKEGGGEEGELKQTGTITEKSVVFGERNSNSQNGSVSVPQFDIDGKLLIAGRRLERVHMEKFMKESNPTPSWSMKRMIKVKDSVQQITRSVELYSTETLRQGEKKHYNNKVDVYSFGIVLWELLTNRMPFEGMSNLQAAYAAAFKQMRPSVPEDIPPDLAFIIQSCWVEDANGQSKF